MGCLVLLFCCPVSAGIITLNLHGILLNDQDPYLIEIVSDDPAYEGKLYKVKWYSGAKVWSEGEWVDLTNDHGLVIMTSRDDEKKFAHVLVEE